MAQEVRHFSMGKALIATLAGLFFVILGSNITVDAAVQLAKDFGVSDRFIGLTIIALGTSLPELFTSLSAARKGNADIAIGIANVRIANNSPNSNIVLIAIFSFNVVLKFIFVLFKGIYCLFQPIVALH